MTRSMAGDLGSHTKMALRHGPAAQSDLAARIDRAVTAIMAAETRSKSNVIRVLLAEALKARGYEIQE